MDSPEHVDLLVIGSGPAGVHAAVGYVRSAAPPVGSVTLVSADTDPPYQRPPLSKDVLAGRQPASPVPILDDDADRAAWGEVRQLLGTTVVALDTARRVVRCDDGRELGYERLVLATGSDPVRLPGADPAAPVFLLRSLAQARDLTGAADRARDAVVVGSGFIGCEAAAALAARGVRTVLVTPETAPRAARLGTWAASRITRWLTAAGVELRTGVEVERVERTGAVHLADGEQLPADLVLTAVGVRQARPSLEESGLRTDEVRLVVDSELRTEDERVWAAGDVTLAHHAVADRALAVEHWGDGFDHATVVEHDDGAFTVWYADAAGELVGVLTHGRDEDYERGGELLARRAGLDEALAPR